MPTWLRDDIQGFLYDVATFFRRISYRFEDAADWAADIPGVGYYIAYALYKIADYCYDANYLFKDLMWGWLDLCDWLDHVWDDIGYLWNEIDDLWDYARYTLRGLVNDALAAASDALSRVTVAYDKAVAAWNYATGWLTDRANEAWSRAGAVWGSVTNYLKGLAIDAYNKAVWAYNAIAPAITSAKQAIYAWVRSIPAEIKNYVSSVVASIKSWALGVVNDAKASVLATIAAPFNLITYWFNDIQDFFNSPLDWLWGKFTDWFLGPEK